ncbi:transcriptional repressor TCF25-domain-containing protein, partial [Vararia minispora EC-137]
MAPRLSKRQQRELDELDALSGGLTPVSSASEDDAPAQAQVQSAFAALMSAGNDTEDEEDEAPVRKAKKVRIERYVLVHLLTFRAKPKKKKKKGAVSAAVESSASAAIPAPIPSSPVPAAPNPAPLPKSAPAPPDSTSTPAEPTMSKKERQALKRQRAKERQGKDEIDRALEELASKDPTLPRPAASKRTSATATAQWHALLAVSPSHLDPDTELRKFFGAKVVSAAKAGTGGRRERSALTKPKSTWWPANLREGLSLRALSEEEVKGKDGERWWTVEYSKRYKGVTRAFMQVVLAGDPEGLYNVLRVVPWHADTLLQLSEVYRHREEHSTAVDFIERAIFTYERAFVGSFNLSGAHRLDFSRVENRPFFLAVHRQTADLQRRGVFRTAFEWARLLWSLDPWSDPHGALLHLDFLSIKAGMHDWLLSVSRALASSDTPTLDLPGWAYARALALRFQLKNDADADADEADQALREAIREWPAVVPLLADKADINLDPAVRAHGAFKIFVKDIWSNETETLLHLLANLYVARSAPLWKDPALGTWLARTASSLVHTRSLPSSPTSSPAFARLSARPRPFARAVYRHVVVLQPVRLLSFLPARISSAGGLACDPLPPEHATSAYDDPAFFRGAEDPFALRLGRRRNANAAQERRLLERLVPDAGLRGELEGFFGAHPALARQFPGGVVQFAQAAAGMEPEVLQEMMVGMAMQEEGGDGRGVERGRMPGGMPGEDGLVFLEFGEGEEGGDEGEWEEDEAGEAGGLERGEGDEDVGAGAEEDEGQDEEEEEYVAPAPVRVLRNLIRHFWPIGGTAEASSSEDE